MLTSGLARRPSPPRGTDMPAGLSGVHIRRMPPRFCAHPVCAAVIAASNAAAAAMLTYRACMPTSTSLCPSPPALSPWGLSVQPHVFHAPAVVDAIDHRRQPLDLRLPAGGKNIVKNDRASSVFLQFPIDLPYQPLALVLIGHRGLFVELLV